VSPRSKMGYDDGPLSTPAGRPAPAAMQSKFGHGLCYGPGLLLRPLAAVTLVVLRQQNRAL
jgi:hypothetical protein